jgi:hypothetical protein
MKRNMKEGKEKEEQRKKERKKIKKKELKNEAAFVHSNWQLIALVNYRNQEKTAVKACFRNQNVKCQMLARRYK